MDTTPGNDEAPDNLQAYEPPTITDLGTLADLTLGGGGGTSDGVGMGGASGGGGSVTLQAP